MVSAPASLSLKGRALRALAARELTRAELQTKLAPHVQADAEPDALIRLLDELQAKGFLSDERAAEALAARRSPKLGTQRVMAELRGRGVPSEAMGDLAEQLKATEPERARAVWQKKFGELPTTVEQRAKQMRFLASRGFEAAVVAQVLRAEREA
jgi:regulatory protein